MDDQTTHDQSVLITGGAGFIGSHLTDRLVERGATVTVVDDLSNGNQRWVTDEARFVEGDLTDAEMVESVLSDEIDIVYHLAASKKVDSSNPREQFERNGEMTYNLLERMQTIDTSRIVFTSSSTVYGEAPHPTPEDFAPLEPISIYGASKLADEGLLSVYAHTYDFTVYAFRFANIVGPRLRGAVIPDFIRKLQDNPKRLHILGDGRQQKSYMHITDCLDAIEHAVQHTDNSINIYNVGTRTTTSVDRIADIVSGEMNLNPDYTYTDTERGWKGDVTRMRLSIEKLAATGWEPQLSSDEAVRKSVIELLDEL